MMKKKDSYTEIIIKEQQISSVHCCKSKNVGLHIYCLQIEMTGHNVIITWMVIFPCIHKINP
jgi:hypothetical protein